MRSSVIGKAKKAAQVYDVNHYQRDREEKSIRIYQLGIFRGILHQVVDVERSQHSQSLDVLYRKETAVP